MEQIDEPGWYGFRFVLDGKVVAEGKWPKQTVADAYRGIWRAGEYRRGDMVTCGGSGWICLANTTAKPETSKDWVLFVKRGMNGKDGAPGSPGAQGPKGDPGRDGKW
jgi:integrin beta 3